MPATNSDIWRVIPAIGGSPDPTQGPVVAAFLAERGGNLDLGARKGQRGRTPTLKSCKEILSSAQLGIEDVAKGVAEEVEAEHREGDRQAREDGDPGRALGVFLGPA